MHERRRLVLRDWRVLVSRSVLLVFASWRSRFSNASRTNWRSWPTRWRVRSPAAQRYLREAQAWRTATAVNGAPPVRAVPDVAITHWWMGELDRSGEAVPPVIRAWQTASEVALERAQPGWLDTYVRTRVRCGCGQRWRVESVAFCTHCAAVHAPCCMERARLPRWRNGNAVCPRCQAGEVVG